MKTLVVSMLAVLALSMVMPLAFAQVDTRGTPIDIDVDLNPLDNVETGMLVCFTILLIGFVIVALILKLLIPVILSLPPPFNIIVGFLVAIIIIFVTIITIIVTIQCVWVNF